MVKKNILVTGVGGDIGQSIIKCLKDTKYEVFLVGCDIDPFAAGRKETAEFAVAPKAVKAKSYLKFLCNIINQFNIKYIYPSTEQEITFFDKYRHYFNSKNIIVFINNSFIINTFFDKHKTINFLKHNRLPYPKTFLIEEFNDQLDYPLIVKPRRGCGNREIIKVNNVEELVLYKKIKHDFIVQKYLQGEDEEYTTGVFSNGRDIYSITFKRKLGDGGWSKIVELIIDDKVSALAEKIAQNSNLIGSVNIQTRKTSNGFVVFEINPRFSSTVYFRHYFGFQDVKWCMDQAEKREIVFKLKYKKGVGVRTLTEVFFKLE